MRLYIALHTALASILFAQSAFAAENEAGNMFSADLSNPDLALAVSHFEETCMPFILHKTEMTQKLDGQHMAKLMTSRGFEYMESETRARRVAIEPSREEWTPKTQAINSSHSNRNVSVPSGSFTIFNGTALPRGTQQTPTIVNPTGEIIGPFLTPAIYKSVTTEHLTYGYTEDNRLTAHIGWNYASQNHPGKSCEIKLAAPSITETKFAADFIEKDEDWFERPQGWQQCVRDGDNEFEFTVRRETDAISIHVKRNDFYEPDICVN